MLIFAKILNSSSRNNKIVEIGPHDQYISSKCLVVEKVHVSLCYIGLLR